MLQADNSHNVKRNNRRHSQENSQPFLGVIGEQVFYYG